MALILCGFLCAGKTTYASLLSKRLGLPWVDTDNLIEKREGRSIWEVHRALGEAQFREKEKEVIFSLKKESVIIATGGGSLIKQENRDALCQLGTSIYLKASYPTLFARLSKRGMPSFLEKEAPYEACYQLAKRRFPLYEQFADHTIDTDELTKNEVIDTLAKIYGK